MRFVHTSLNAYVNDRTSSIYRKVKLKNSARCFFFLSFRRFGMNSASYEYKNKSAGRGAQLVPIGIVCWHINLQTQQIYCRSKSQKHFDSIIFGIFSGRFSVILQKNMNYFNPNKKFVSTIPIFIEKKLCLMRWGSRTFNWASGILV